MARDSRPPRFSAEALAPAHPPMLEYPLRGLPMRNAMVSVAFAAAACVTAPKGPHVIQRQSLAQIEPAERDQLFARALNTLQRRGWIIAVSDRAGGLLTTQQMATGAKPCGTITCDSSSTLQVAITETVISVNLHREFVNQIGRAHV